jgi:D-inositol-3-phosphate glycosyltransferase
MKVALVSEHASPLAALGGVDAGGQNVHVAALATALARLGSEVVVHTRRDDPGLAEWVELGPNVTVHHVRAGPAQPIPKDHLLPHMDAFATELARVWSSDRVAAGAVVGVPVVQTFHALGVVKRRYQGDQDSSPAARQRTELELLGEVDRVIATCSDEVVELARMGADLSRIEVVPCGVDLDLFRPLPGGRRPTRRILTVGRLVERKGVGDVIEALAQVPDAQLLVAGGPAADDLDSDGEARRLQALAARLGVSDRVRLLGRVARADLPALLHSVDAVVCVPWYEPFGLVPLEAMACGVPVVASAVGGLLDTVVNGVTGIHVPPRSPEPLAGALRQLLDEPDLGRRLGAAGLRRVRSGYGWRAVASSTLDVYREVHRPVLRAAVGRTA